MSKKQRIKRNDEDVRLITDYGVLVNDLQRALFLSERAWEADRALSEVAERSKFAWESRAAFRAAHPDLGMREIP